MIRGPSSSLSRNVICWLLAGIMVEGVKVRDMLPRAPARISKQVEINDIILSVDGRPVTPKDVLTCLKGSDQGHHALFCVVHEIPCRDT